MSFVFSRFLGYFAEVARLGSIRKASEHLNVAASAINRQILQAEAELGLPLFERLPAGLRPTAAGEMLLHGAGQWQQDFARIRVQMNDLKGLRRGHVRIALIDALSQGFVVRAIHAMRRDYPGISFTLNVIDNVDVLARVIDGEADFGLMLNPQTTRDVRVQAHADIHLGFVTAPGHPLTGAAHRRFNACIDYPLIAPAAPLAIHEQLRALQAATGVDIQPTVASDNIQMIKSLARDGIGVAVLSQLDALEEVARGDLAFVRISDPVIKPLTLALCVAQARQLSHAANLCLGRIEDGFERFDEPGN